MKTLLIVDGNSLAYRAFYALPLLTNKKGSPTGALYGFANILIRLITEHAPDYIAVCFDHARKTFRNNIYADYKGTRHETPEDLRIQFPYIYEMLRAMGIKTFEESNLEADDLIGSIVRQARVKSVILSGDRDLLQLIDNNTEVWLTKKGISEILKVKADNIVNEFGVSPAGIIELKSLMGDSSDNIPGVSGVGEKTALSLISEFGSLDNVYANIESVRGKLREKLEANKAMAYMSKQLATIKTDCEINFDIDDCTYDFPFTRVVRDFFEDKGFNSILKRNELFGNTLLKESRGAERIPFTTASLKGLGDKVSSTLAFDVEKLEFFVDGSIYYFNKTPDIFSEMLSDDEVFKELKPAFESEKVLKLSNDIKKAMHLLAKFGIEIKGEMFDVCLANYLIDPGGNFKNRFGVHEFEVAYANLTSEMNVLKLTDVFEKIERPLTPLLYRMEREGIKLDKDELVSLKVKNETKRNDLIKLIYLMAGEEFNVNSPKQLSEILFNKLRLETWKNKKKSTGHDILDEIKNKHPIVPLILEYRKIQKITSTYIDVYEECLKTTGDIIHTTFEQMVTSTGRLSSTNPNLQNIPIRDEMGREIRKVFVSKFDGGKFLTFDYNQIELRLLAHLSGDESLTVAFREGRDIHAETAMGIFRQKREDITPELRRTAKAVNFGIVYGISDYGLAQGTGNSVGEAKEYIQRYFERYPGVKEYMNANVEFAKAKGYVSTIYGRRRGIPEIHSANYNLRLFGERVAMNMPLQGSASDIIKLAMVNVDKRLKKFRSHIVLQIHDELVIDAYPGEEDEVLKLVKEEMEHVVKLNVEIPVSVGVGRRLFDCDK